MINGRLYKMKKILSFFLTLCLVTSLTIPFASASGTDQTSAQQTVQALGIINGDENGNLNLSEYVTRAQFAKMMIAASTYKDTISSTSSSSPFKDVKYSYWAASYIKTAVAATWLSGYTDGTYRPDNNMTLEEAVSAVLKMLGYTSTDFSGSFPEAQLATYAALGLNDNISTTQGQTITRQDCMYLFYNLMSTENTSDKYYATTLGYTVNSSGEIDYSSLVLANMKGPYIVSDSTWMSSLPFSTSTATVYLNGSVSSFSAVSTYDVYYYNASMRTVWVYNNRVTGIYTAASPNTAAPTSVTVAGNSYTLATSSATYDLSDIGSYGIGDTVTLLLGKNGDVVGVESATTINSTKYGIVTNTGTQSYSDAAGNTYKYNIITMAATDGNTYTYQVDSSSTSSVGALVRATVSGGTTSITTLTDVSLSGAVNSAATTLGSYTFSSDIQIMDTTENGSYVKVYPSRLSGLSLSSGDVRYYLLDTSGKICQLILRNVTDDMYSYGIITNDPKAASMGSSTSYTYILNGTTSTVSSTKSFGVTSGPAMIEIVSNSIVSLKNLTAVTLSSLNSSYGISNSVQYPIASNVVVYIYNTSTSYSLSNISAVSDTSAYTLSGCYDKAASSGGQIRMIIAYKK
jgi:hypothetical protein